MSTIPSHKTQNSETKTNLGYPLDFAFNIPKKRTFQVLLFVAILGVSLIFSLSRIIVVYEPVPAGISLNIYIDTVTQMSDHQVQPLARSRQAMSKPVLGSLSCWPVLERASYGQWVPRSHTAVEKAAIEKFIVTVRGYEKLPVSVQRRDNRCGNVNMAEKGRPGGLSWYKALCDPAGNKSCCYSNHTCVNLPVSQCQCSGCHDLRQQIHAELATWVPHDTRCKIKIYKDETDICPVLKNMTVHVMGDSFLRQVFISLVATLRSKKPGGIITDPKISSARREHCDEYLKYFSKCADVIPLNATECGSTVLFRRVSLWRASQISEILKVFEQYVGRPDSFVIFGQGIHDMYHPDVTIKKVLTPVLDVLNRHPLWPQMIWIAPQSPGILKTPLVKQQQRETVAKFNAVVTPFLRSHGIPVLDGYNLTFGSVMSYDGTHYGKGVNDLKAQILLNYFSELRQGVS